MTQPSSTHSAPTSHIPLAAPNGSAPPSGPVPPPHGPTPFPPGPNAGYGPPPGHGQNGYGQPEYGPPGLGQPAGPGRNQPPGPGQPAGPGQSPGPGPGQPTGFGQPPNFDQPPGFGQPPAAAPSTAPSLTLAGGAQLLAVVLTGLGLSIPFSDANFWSTSLAWALFAMAAALLQLAPLFGRNSQSSPRTVWLIGACGAGGLLGFWVLIALPGVSSNQGFVLTLAAAAAVVGCWLSPGRPR